MRSLIALIVLVYLVGVGVALAPTLTTRWNSGTPAEFFAAGLHDLPVALQWPVTVYHSFVNQPSSATATPTPDQTSK